MAESVSKARPEMLIQPIWDRARSWLLLLLFTIQEAIQITLFINITLVHRSILQELLHIFICIQNCLRQKSKHLDYI